MNLIKNNLFKIIVYICTLVGTLSAVCVGLKAEKEARITGDDNIMKIIGVIQENNKNMMTSIDGKLEILLGDKNEVRRKRRFIEDGKE